MLGTRTSRPHPRAVVPDIEDGQFFALRADGKTRSQQSFVSFYRVSQPVDHSLGKLTQSEEFEKLRAISFDDSDVGSRPDSFLISSYQVLNLALPRMQS